MLLVDAMKEALNSQYFEIMTPLYKRKDALSGWMQKSYELHEIINKIVQELPQYVDGPLLYVFIHYNEFIQKIFLSLKWQWICVLKLFFEHILLHNEEKFIFFARRIQMVLCILEYVISYVCLLF